MTSTNTTADANFHESYFNWPHAGWWAAKEARASEMTIAQLQHARQDCHEAAQAGRLTLIKSKYIDEGTVYARELARRGIRY